MSLSTSKANPEPKASPPKRMTRAEWLEHALDYLAREGEAKLTIDRLVRALGVTKGSFYWHFEDRDDFLRGLIEYWEDQFTRSVLEQVSAMEASPSERLLAIAETVLEKGLARYDVAVRAWAAQEQGLAALVRRVDMARFRAVRQLFHELGFSDAELEMRTRCFVTYVSLEPALTVKQSKKRSVECIRKFHALITLE